MASDSPLPPIGTGGLFDFRTMLEAMEVARRSWSAVPIPSSMTPTIDPEELDKRIADLKTVEQWLVLNLNLLRGSIQALELQRATLSSLQSFGQAARAAAEAAVQAAGDLPGSNSSFAGAPPDPSSASGPAPHASAAGAQASARDGAGDRRAAQPGPAADATPSGWSAGIDPSAWWQTLQTQFQQVAESAMAGMTPATGASSAKADSAPRGKPAAGQSPDKAPQSKRAQRSPKSATPGPSASAPKSRQTKTGPRAQSRSVSTNERSGTAAAARPGTRGRH